jgi:hypothetical protein
MSHVFIVPCDSIHTLIVFFSNVFNRKILDMVPVSLSMDYCHVDIYTLTTVDHV